MKIDWTKQITAEQKTAEKLVNLQAEFSQSIRSHLDAKARERHYDGIQSAITYRDDPNPQFANEADRLFAWRSAVWSHATEQLSQVSAGERTIPSVEEFIAELPAFSWE